MAQTFANGDQLSVVRDVLNGNAGDINVLQSQNAKSVSDVAALLANTSLTYTVGSNDTVAAGNIVQTRAENFSYQVAASGATDQNITTAGGVKLYALTFNAQAFGAVGNGIADDTTALQDALYAAAGRTLYVPKGTYIISDTIYIQPATIVCGESSGDNWGVTSSEMGTRIKTTGVGTALIWTDVGLVSTPEGDLVDAPISVAVVLNGSGITIKNLTLEGGSSASGSDAWGAGFFIPAVKRSTFENVETEGKFSISGCYIDCTWSDRNTALLNLHANTYGVAINSDAGPNETLFLDCYLRGGNWGIYLKFTNRTVPDPGAGIWAWGGASDIVGVSSRIGNDPLGTSPNLPENSGAYYRDLNDIFQNRFWYGCSFRSGSSYTVFLDRGRRENFIGCYGESRPDRCVTRAVSYTVDALGVDKIVLGGIIIRKVYLTATSRIDVIATNTRPGAILTSVAGSMEADAYGYDSVAGRAYFTTFDSDADSLVAGNVVSQAAGQALGNQFYATERATATLGMGALAFSQATFENIYIGSDFVTFKSNNFDVHQSRFTNTNVGISAESEVHINCEDGTQVNFYTNRFGTGSVTASRIRQTATNFSSYNAHDLGNSSQPWGSLYAGSIAMGSSAAPKILTGVGTPLGAVSAPVGSIFLRSDGGAGTSFYVKESGTGNTGWAAK
jgi:hypothetical protein